MKILIVSEAPVPALNISYRADPLATYLSAIGHEVWVMCPKPTIAHMHDQLIEKYRHIKFIHLPSQERTFNLFKRYRFITLLKKKIEDLLKLENFDVIRPISFAPGFATVTVKSKSAVIITNLSDFYSDLYKQFELPLSSAASIFLKRMERKVVAMSDVMLVDSSTQREYWKKWGLKEENCAVVPNGVNTELFNPYISGESMKRKYGVNEGSRLIFYHGDISKLDGVDVLIKVAPSIIDKFRNVKFMIVGSGTKKYMKKLKRQLKENKIEESFLFTGWIPHTQIPEYLALADVCVAPFRLTITSGSNLMNKIIEYIAMLKPVVATRSRGLQEMLGDLIRYVDPENPEMLSGAVIEELEGERRVGINKIMEKVSERLDWRNIALHEERIMKAVLSKETEDYRSLDYKLLT